MKDNETIVIGGLMKDVKSKQTIGIPFLSKIPFLGKAFNRETTDTSKIDLLIFITAHVLKDDEPLPSQVIQSENKFEAAPANTPSHGL
jgi:type II secretory pathway component GspD/PulD (secretin)